MLQAPLRVVGALRTRTPLGIIAALAVSTVVFSATPFLIPAIADDRRIAVGTVGLISTAQLGGFMIATFGAGRVLRPRRTVLVVAAIGGLLVNFASAAAPSFAVLLGSRVLSGVALGLAAWVAWTEAFGNDERVGDVAVIGPIVGTAASPVVALLIDARGPDTLFVVLGLLHLVPLALARSVTLYVPARPKSDRHAPTRAALAILIALGLMTLGGSAVFVYAGAIGGDLIGLGALPLSLAFAANAIAGVPAARFTGSRGWCGFWVTVSSLAALAIGTVRTPVVFWACLIAWGFSYWMGVPRAFALLAERSAHPDERAGDAQAVMAGGRVFGPLVGGAMYALSPEMMSVVGAAIIGTSALSLIYIEWRIRPISSR